MPTGDDPHMSKMLDLTMLAMTGGLERTEQSTANSSSGPD